MVAVSTTPGDVVHHLITRGPGLDLVPYRGVLPGPDKLTGDWHTGHDRKMPLKCVEFGLQVCITCLSPEALGGFTPLSFEEEPVWSDDEQDGRE